jgi:origin recognition complex subunit 3
MNRIPFVLLFGIATSIDLFRERLPRAATKCLFGAQFDVEQTSSVFESVFLKVIAGSEAPLRLGPALVSSLIERQHNHVQSIQAFISALKVRTWSRITNEYMLTIPVCIYVSLLCKSS